MSLLKIIKPAIKAASNLYNKGYSLNKPFQQFYKNIPNPKNINTSITRIKGSENFVKTSKDRIVNELLRTKYYDKFIKMYGAIFHYVEIIPDPIDTAQFYDRKNPREVKILNVGFMHQLKGTNNLFEYIYNNPDLNFVMASWGDQQYERIARSFHNVEWIAPIPHQQMPELYNKYTTMYYHPVFYEPFCRAVGEALLCGMNINSNNLVGSLHYYNEIGEDQFATQCNQATQVFWNHVESV